MRVKQKSEKSGLKFNVQKNKITASDPNTAWWIDGEKVEAVTDLVFLGSNIAVDGHCSHEIKRCLLLGRKAIINLNSVFKSRDITLLTNLHIVKAVVFSVVIYECESWIIKKAECWWTDAFKLWCWEKNLESSLDSKEIKPVNPKGN